MHTALLSLLVLLALVGCSHASLITFMRCKTGCADKDCVKETFDNSGCQTTPYGSYTHVEKTEYDFKIYTSQHCKGDHKATVSYSKGTGCDKENKGDYTVAYLSKEFSFKDGEANYKVKATLCKLPGSDKTKSDECTDYTITEDQFDNGCYGSSAPYRAYRNTGANTVTIAVYKTEAECQLDMLPQYYIKDGKLDDQRLDIYAYFQVDTGSTKPMKPSSAELVIKSACSSDGCGGCGAEEVYKATGKCVKDDQRGGSYEASCVPGVDTSYNVKFFVDDSCQGHLNTSGDTQHGLTGTTSKKCDKYNEKLPPSLLVTVQGTYDSESYKVCPGDSDCSFIATSESSVDSPRPNYIGTCTTLSAPTWCGPTTIINGYPAYVRRTFSPFRMSFYANKQQCLEDIAPLFVIDSAPLPTACAPLQRYRRTLCTGTARHTQFVPPADGVAPAAAAGAALVLAGFLLAVGVVM